MKVHIERSWADDGFNVFLFERHVDGTEILEMRESFGILKPQRTGARHVDHAQSKPTFFLPREVLEAIAAVGQDELRITNVAADAIADARGVRDRLLMLVEQLILEGRP